MAGPGYEGLLEAIDQLYAATLEPQRWSEFLTSVATLFDAQNAFVCEVEYRQRNLAYVGLPQPRRERFPVQRYQTLIDEDPRTPLFRAAGARPVHCRMATSSERLRDSRVYREYLRPLAIEYTMVVVLPIHDGLTRDLGLTRGSCSPAFNQDDIDLMNRLVPHVERAFRINGALEKKLLAAERFRNLTKTDQQTLESAFGLTPAEAKLATLLYNGANVRQAAEQLGITEGSARQYIRRIFGKTQTNRQVDMIRVIGRSVRD
jgi:DNA-binding CsgD family transcriptional regulator